MGTEKPNQELEEKSATPDSQSPESQQVNDLNRRIISNRRERVRNFLELTGIYGELVEECFNFLSREPIDPFADYEKAKEENPNLNLSDYVKQYIDLTRNSLLRIITKRLEKNGFHEIANKTRPVALYIDNVERFLFVKGETIIHLLVKDIVYLLEERLLWYLNFETEEKLVSHIITELTGFINNLDTSEIGNIVLYLTHIEVYINKPNIYEGILGITRYQVYSPSIVVLSNNTSTRIHELEHVKQQLIKETLNPQKNTPNINISETLSYLQLFNEITAYTRERLEECKNQPTYNCFKKEILNLIITILSYEHIKNSPKLQEIELKTIQFFINMLILILLTQDEKKFQEIIDRVLNNLNIKYTNYNTFEILPLRILQSIDPIVGRAQIKFFRKSKRNPNYIDLVELRVKSLKKDLEKEPQKESTLLPKYLNLIKLEIKEEQKKLENLALVTTDTEKIKELQELKEKLDQALRDIQEIEISLSKTKS